MSQMQCDQIRFDIGHFDNNRDSSIYQLILWPYVHWPLHIGHFKINYKAYKYSMFTNIMCN